MEVCVCMYKPFMHRFNILYTRFCSCGSTSRRVLLALRAYLGLALRLGSGLCGSLLFRLSHLLDLVRTIPLRNNLPRADLCDLLLLIFGVDG